MVETQTGSGGPAAAPGGIAHFDLRSLRAAIDAKLIGLRGNSVCSGVSIDSRTVRRGQVFWALEGTRTDGHRFVGDAAAQGACAAVVNKAVAKVPVPLLVVDDTRLALMEAARWYRRVLGTSAVAITGSVGKTTTREMLRCVLESSYRVHAAERSFNNDLGLPLTVLNCPRDCEMLVLEVGTSSPGEVADLAVVADPDVAVVTAVGPAHLAGLGTIEGVLREKLSLFWRCRRWALRVLNVDSLAGMGFSPVLPRNVLTYSLRPGQSAADVCGRWVPDPRSPRLIVDRAVFRLPAFGEPMAYAALATVAVARELGLSHREIQDGLDRFAPLEGRSRLWDCGERLVLDDAYNANPLSVRSCVATLAALARSRNWRPVLVLGDLLELGRDEGRLLRELGESIAPFLACLVVCGPRAALVAEGAARTGLPCVYVATSVDEAVRFVREQYGAESVIGVKGARAARMERVVRRLVERSEQSREAA